MTITLRSTKGAPLSHTELDGNFEDLDDRVETLEDVEAEANPAAASLAEATAGTETALRSWSPLRVAQAASFHGGGEEGGSDDQTAAEVPFSPAGDIASVDVQGAIEELDAEKAALSHSHVMADITNAGVLADLDEVDTGQIAAGAIQGSQIFFSQQTAESAVATVSVTELDTDAFVLLVDDAATDILRLDDPAARRSALVVNNTGGDLEIEAEDESAILAVLPDKHAAIITYTGTANTWTSDAVLVLEDAIVSGATGQLENVAVDAATDDPVAGTRTQYDTVGGTLVILGDDWDAEGEGQLVKGTGAGAVHIYPDNGFGINGSDQAGSDVEVTDAVWGTPSGAAVSVTSAGTNLPDFDEGDVVRVTEHSTAANNGPYLVGATHTTAEVALTKLEGGNPEAASSEAADFALMTPLELLGIATVWRGADDVDQDNFVVLGDVDTAKDFFGVNLTNFGRPVGLVEQTTGQIDTADDAAYFLDQSAAYPYDINTLSIECDSGTCTAALEINGTPVTDISAVSVSGTEATGTASAANSVVVGDTVELVLSSNSDALKVRFTIKTTRT